MANTFDEIKQALSNIKTEDFKYKDEPTATGIIAEEIGELDTSTVSTSLWNTSNYSIGYPGIGGQCLTSTGSNGINWNNPFTFNSSSKPALSITGDAEFEGNVKIKGVNIIKLLEDIQNRLAILVPDPAKLEHFEALKKSYNNYKTLEALCDLPKETKE
jgi:hypothetical protein